MFQLPLYRLSGLYAPANGEVSTALFALPTAGIDGLWLNAAAGWKGGLVTGGCDESCAAYVMVELQDSSARVWPGFERSKCMFMNVDAAELPLRWSGQPKPPPAGTMVRLRFFFRDATIYAFGSH